MKVHPVTDAHMQMFKIDPPHGYELCVYQAEEDDPWHGFVAGRCGWDGSGPTPENPASTFHRALTNWVQQFTAYRLTETPALVKTPPLTDPPRHNSCRLNRTKNLGAAMKDRSGSIRTSIQGPCSSTVVAA